jgi:hypothetical protein
MNCCLLDLALAQAEPQQSVVSAEKLKSQEMTLGCGSM